MNTQFDEVAYYSRQTILPEIGLSGQARLRSSKVAVVGLGGLGSVSALYLTLSGVGSLRLVDQDTVEINNLHRQALYTLSDIRHAKVEIAAKRLAELNPTVNVESIADNVNNENIESVLAGSDCVVDGLDNMYTRYLLNRYCVEHKIPYVFGGAIGLEGNVAVFKTPETPCLECILPGLDDSILPTCDVRGVLGATPGVVGAIQAIEAIKFLAGVNQKIEAKLMIFDFAQSEFRTIDLNVRKDCPVCQKKRSTYFAEKRIAWLCGSSTANVNPQQPAHLDLRSVGETLKGKHSVLLVTPTVLVFDYRGHEISLFQRGRMLIKNVTTEAEALRLYKEIQSLVGI
jgi:molybdopterin/thiamine biosynthesis adenylyltransferase